MFNNVRGEVWHPVLGPVGYKVSRMSYDPDDQVRQTLGLMRERVAEDSGDPVFTARVQRMFGVRTYPGVSGPMNTDEVELARRIWQHTKRSIRFQRDEVTGEGIAGLPQEEVVETIIRPVDMAQFVDSGGAVGDCDDFSMYEACCLKALGIPCAFVTIAADGRAPGQYSHVYVVAYPMDPSSGQRVRMPLDASHGEYPGWEKESIGRYDEWPVWDRLSWWIGNAFSQAVLVIGGIYLFQHFRGRFA